MIFQTGYNVGDTIVAKDPHLAKTVTFVIGQIKVQTLPGKANLQLAEYRSVGIGLDGYAKSGKWYPEKWVLRVAFPR